MMHVVVVAFAIITSTMSYTGAQYLDPMDFGGIFVTTTNELVDMQVYGSVDVLCTDSCVEFKQEYFGGDYLSDYCSDGGPANGTQLTYKMCPLGSDCSACGPRTVVAFDTIHEAVGNYTSQDGVFDGSLYVESTALTTLDGMQPVRRITGDLSVRYNFQLEDTLALRSLTSVDRTLQFQRNLLPGPLLGLEALVTVGEDFFLLNNTELEIIENVDSLDSIGGGLYIEYSGALRTVTMGALTSIGAAFPNDYSNNELHLGSNPVLESANFNMLSYLEGDFLVAGNAGIPNLGISNLKRCSSFDVYRNDGSWLLDPSKSWLLAPKGVQAVDLVGPSTMLKVGAGPSGWGFFEVTRNPNLGSISGFENLVSLGFGNVLSIQENDVLTSISGFDSISLMNNYLEIVSNTALQNITGFQSLTNINGDLRLNNTNLLFFEAFNNLDYVKGCCELEPAWLLEKLPACQEKLCASTISA